MLASTIENDKPQSFGAPEMHRFPSHLKDTSWTHCSYQFRNFRCIKAKSVNREISYSFLFHVFVTFKQINLLWVGLHSRKNGKPFIEMRKINFVVLLSNKSFLWFLAVFLHSKKSNFLVVSTKNRLPTRAGRRQGLNDSFQPDRTVPSLAVRDPQCRAAATELHIPRFKTWT